MSPACELTQRSLDGRGTAEEHAEAKAHLETCPSCQALARTWEQFSKGYLGQVGAVAAPAPEETRRMMRKARGELRPQARRWPALSLAAAGAVAFAVAVAVWWTRPAEPVPATTELADGQETPLTGDTVEGAAEKGALLHIGGDRVGVAPRSRVRLLQHDKKRVRVRLEQGAVAAAVVHREPGQSFAIESGNFQVTVVGTRFRVTRVEDGLRVDVAEGHVRVTSTSGGSYDVLKGNTLEVHGTASEVSTYSGTDFAELGAPAQPVIEAVPVEPDAGVAEPEPARKPRAASAAELERWRRAGVAGHCPDVVAEIGRAVRDNPRQAEAWRVLADCQRLIGDNRAAVQAYQRVISFSNAEEADRARLLLAGVLHDRLANDAEAERVLRAYLRRPKPATLEAGARVLLARTLIAQRRPAEAREELRRVTRRLPSSPEALEALELLKTLK